MRNLAYIFLIILLTFSCKKSQDENINQISDIQKRRTNRLRRTPSIIPIKGGEIVSRFGAHIDSLTKKASFNKGIDIAVQNEDNVFATADGKIIEVNYGTRNNENLIIIDHSYGIQTRYSNLSDILVKSNELVKRWSIIGKVKGSDQQPILLHYEVIKNGEYVDPERFIF